MKTTITFLLAVCTLPSILPAQPSLSMCDFYYVGDIINMANCDNPLGLTAGAPGAGKQWDFSTLRANGTFANTAYARENTSSFNANLLEIRPDGKKVHLQQNNSLTLINGIEDPVTQTSTYYYNYKISQRPISYQTVYNDTFRMVVPTVATGTGYLVENGDAYGTLVLPNGTYNNVLRVRRSQLETDTVNAAVNSSTAISYLWFDNTHHAPLLRMDSVINISGVNSSIMYLATPSAVRNLGSQQPDYNGRINNNELVLTGPFENGAAYDVIVYNIIGSKVFTSSFTAYGNALRFDMGRQVNTGIYMVSISQKNEPASKQVIKVMKQS
jgi:hypothetical protein